MRHAKSDWNDPSLKDFDRPLNERGKKSAPKIGKQLVSRNKIPDLILSSPAMRAKSTAEIIARETDYKETIQHEKEFYFGDLSEIIDIIKKTNDLYNIVLMVGHNPTFESLVNKLSGKGQIHELPTASVVSILFDVKSWKLIEPQKGQIEWQISPKDF